MPTDYYTVVSAGETVDEAQPVLRFLRGHGINFILNYAAEEDVNTTLSEGAVDSTDSPEERARDLATKRFLRDVQSADNVTTTPFIAVKVSEA